MINRVVLNYSKHILSNPLNIHTNSQELTIKLDILLNGKYIFPIYLPMSYRYSLIPNPVATI